MLASRRPGGGINIGCERHMEAVAHGDWHWRDQKKAIVDCRGLPADYLNAKHGGGMADPFDVASAPWPGPYKHPSIKFLQLLSKSMGNLNWQDTLKPHNFKKTRTVLDWVYGFIAGGYDIDVCCKAGQFRSDAATSKIISPWLEDTMSFIRMMRPIAHPEVPWQESASSQKA